MSVKQAIVAAILLGVAPLLGSCSGFSGYVADNWPHWAGGMPADVPPRPGAPGYNEFIAHGQAEQDVLKPTVTGSTAAGTSATGTPAGNSAAPAPAPASAAISFAATGQKSGSVAAPARLQPASTQQGTAAEPAPVPGAAAEAAPADGVAADDQPSASSSVVRGGLY